MKQGIPTSEEPVDNTEPIDAFITRLKKKAARCSFTNANTEIKYQVIFGCQSPQLRRHGLQKDDISLDDLVKKGREYETSKKQASVRGANHLRNLVRDF